MCSRAAFRLDEDYDKVYASDGVSRYGAYVRDRLSDFAECWNGTWGDPQSLRVDFAATAWRVATSPVMAPGYVRFHPRILDARLGRNDWDGSMTATVILATPWPRPLTSSHEWQRGTHWRDWPVTRDFGTDDVTYHEPAEQDLTRSAYAMTSVSLAFPLPDGGLPTPPSGPTKALESTARKAVAGMVDALNRIVTPVVQAMD